MMKVSAVEPHPHCSFTDSRWWVTAFEKGRRLKVGSRQCGAEAELSLSYRSGRIEVPKQEGSARVWRSFTQEATVTGVFPD